MCVCESGSHHSVHAPGVRLCGSVWGGGWEETRERRHRGNVVRQDFSLYIYCLGFKFQCRFDLIITTDYDPVVSQGSTGASLQFFSPSHTYTPFSLTLTSYKSPIDLNVHVSERCEETGVKSMQKHRKHEISTKRVQTRDLLALSYSPTHCTSQHAQNNVH